MRTRIWKAQAEFGLSAITVHLTQKYVSSKWAFQSKIGLEHNLKKKKSVVRKSIAFNKANEENCTNETTKKKSNKTKTSKVNNEG